MNIEQIAETIWRAECLRATGKERSISWAIGLSESDKEKYRFIARAIMAPMKVTDTELLRRAVMNSRDHRHRKGVKHPRWVAIMCIFALGSTVAHELCRRFDLDPDEQVKM